MIEAPEITHSRHEMTAVIHIQCPRDRIKTEVEPAIKEVLAVLARQRQSPKGALLMRHLSTSASGFDVEIGYPIGAPLQDSGRVRTSALPEAQVARTIYHGPYEGLHSAWDAFGKRLERERLVDPALLSPIETLWERYLVGPEASGDSSQWRTELNLPLSPAAKRGAIR